MTKTKAFTLVELIVVITILAILWTIAFISLQWHSENARDSVRISDMKNIEKWLELMLTKRWTVSLPEDKVDIIANWTVFAYQWYAWKTTLQNIITHLERIYCESIGVEYMYIRKPEQIKAQNHILISIIKSFNQLNKTFLF